MLRKRAMISKKTRLKSNLMIIELAEKQKKSNRTRKSSQTQKILVTVIMALNQRIFVKSIRR